jgi:hypothetical protein
MMVSRLLDGSGQVMGLCLGLSVFMFICFE